MGDTICVKDDGGFFGFGIYLKQKKAGFSEEHARYIHLEVSGGGNRSVRIAPPRAKVIDITKVYAGRYIKILRYTGEDWDRKRKHIAWINATLCNTKYDRKGILGFLVGWIKHHVSKWFCSEGWLYSHQAEYPGALKGMAPDKCMPAHAVRSPELRTIWEGYVPRKV